MVDASFVFLVLFVLVLFVLVLVLVVLVAVVEASSLDNLCSRLVIFCNLV